jgi:dTDP-4-dehydrorhamnose 3,5-epimerase
MKITQTAIPEILIIEPEVYIDNRGSFFESFNHRNFVKAIHKEVSFVQDNHSVSIEGAVRGLHYQVKTEQAKLVRVIYGEIYDVAVDLRKKSPTFGKWVGHVLSAENKKQMWIPKGFAHGFMALSEKTEVLYKADNYYSKEDERSIRWNDSDIAISWPSQLKVIVSPKDLEAGAFHDAEYF